MFNRLADLASRASPYTPDRTTLRNIRSSKYTSAALTIASTTATATCVVAGVAGTATRVVAGATFNHAVAPVASFAYSSIVPTNAQEGIEAAAQHVVLVGNTAVAMATGHVDLGDGTSIRLANRMPEVFPRVINGIANVLRPDMNDPRNNPLGYTGEPCDTELVEMFDQDENHMDFYAHQCAIVDRYCNNEGFAEGIGGDGMENVSLYQRRGGGKGEMGEKCKIEHEDWTLVDSEDEIDEKTENFYQERLGDSVDALASGFSPTGHRRRSISDVAFEVDDNLSPDEEEERREMERLVLETKWRKSEATRADRGEKPRALDDIIDHSSFAPSTAFMKADLEGGRKYREEQFLLEREKYEKDMKRQEEFVEEALRGRNGQLSASMEASEPITVPRESCRDAHRRYFEEQLTRSAALKQTDANDDIEALEIVTYSQFDDISDDDDDSDDESEEEFLEDSDYYPHPIRDAPATKLAMEINAGPDGQDWGNSEDGEDDGEEQFLEDSDYYPHPDRDAPATKLALELNAGPDEQDWGNDDSDSESDNEAPKNLKHMSNSFMANEKMLRREVKEKGVAAVEAEMKAKLKENDKMEMENEAAFVSATAKIKAAREKEAKMNWKKMELAAAAQEAARKETEKQEEELKEVDSGIPAELEEEMTDILAEQLALETQEEESR